MGLGGSTILNASTGMIRVLRAGGHLWRCPLTTASYCNSRQAIPDNLQTLARALQFSNFEAARLHRIRPRTTIQQGAHERWLWYPASLAEANSRFALDRPLVLIDGAPLSNIVPRFESRWPQ
jgi:hypothetical protein